ncbi:LytR/AlgR family response regulator transcription factor [Clostridioides sp. ES-S-0190-01]|uniref:LytR/AlgR family response regulator transcription factor n=1 Tax=Clostridioides sp. ES-S-0190-01 TaxID=2770787 RepID=UPI001D102A62|nr:response regulator transcription factor [Clostridioides sp. ES-S-0190-01]
MKAIIVEDEFPARKELRYFIENKSEIEVVSEFTNGIEVLDFIQENKIDVIFLDINIPHLDGMLLAKTLNQFKARPKIVFITACENYAVDAFSLGVFDYVLKPYSEDRITSMLDKLEKSETNSSEISSDNNHISSDKKCIINQNIEEITHKISLWKGDKLVVIDIDDIYYCEANERQTFIYTEKETFILKEGISEVENIINDKTFFRTHRSYIVNLTKVKEIIPWFNNTYILKLKDSDYEVTVSRSRIKEFRLLMHI